jgi:3-phenylpropionate/trans-cinnamate dioxygenase ferredoxin subunit
MAFRTVAKVEELAPGSAKQVVIDGRKVALFNADGTFYAIEDTCSHRAASLSQGKLKGTEVTCPWHATRFDITTGKHKNPPATRGVAAYKVQVVGDEVQVDIYG